MISLAPERVNLGGVSDTAAFVPHEPSLEAGTVTITALLAPRSVAVLGASERASVGRGIVEALERIGFTGPIYPVNPRYQTVAGHNCYGSLKELPEAPDVVAFCIRNDGVVENLRA